MMYARDYREQAFQALSGRWGVAVGTGLVASLLGARDMGVRIPNLNYRYNDTLSLYYNPYFLTILLGILCIALVYAIVLFFIGGAFTLGYAQFNINVIDNTNPRFGNLFSKFNMFWTGFIMQFLTGLFIFLWALLLIIPGIIAAYSYAMTPYILLENPEMPVLDAISRSKVMMRGNKGRLFCLEISFIGWALLCLITCGIGVLWLYPYMSAARAAFFNEVSGKNRRRYEYYNGGYNNNGYNNNGYYSNGFNNNGFNNNGFNNNGFNNNGYNNNGFNNNGYNNNGYNNNGYNNNGYNNNGQNNNGYNNSFNNNGYNNNGYNNNGYNNNGLSNNGLNNNGLNNNGFNNNGFNNNGFNNNGQNNNGQNNNSYSNNGPNNNGLNNNGNSNNNGNNYTRNPDTENANPGINNDPDKPVQ
jgi:uncharacterized membrane protein